MGELVKSRPECPGVVLGGVHESCTGSATGDRHVGAVVGEGKRHEHVAGRVELVVRGIAPDAAGRLLAGRRGESHFGIVVKWTSQRGGWW